MNWRRSGDKLLPQPIVDQISWRDMAPVGRNKLSTQYSHDSVGEIMYVVHAVIVQLWGLIR